MQKILCALVAVCSLLTANLRPTQAQGNAPAAEPPPAPKQIDEPANGAKHPMTDAHGDYVVGPEQTVANVAATDRRVLLQGHIEKDVLAVNCDVTIEKSATVGGHLVLVGGKLTNRAGDAVKVVQQDEALAGELRHALGTGSQPTMARRTVSAAPVRNEQSRTRHDWLGAQFALLLFGLLGALILRIAAPRATEEVAETISLQPGRSLLIGGLSALALLLVLLVNAELLKVESGFGLVWKPFGIALALAPLIPMMLGWLAGMRYAGNLIARRLGRPEQAGLFGRMLLGLFIFFVGNALCGLLNEGLGVIGLGLECVFAVMGLGAALMTGFGTRPNWLAARWSR